MTKKYSKNKCNYQTLVITNPSVPTKRSIYLDKIYNPLKLIYYKIILIRFL